MRTFAEGISASIQSLLSAGNDWQSPTTPACKLLEELLQLTQTIGAKASSLVPEAVNESFAVLLEKLYSVVGKCSSSNPTHALAQKVCAYRARASRLFCGFAARLTNPTPPRPTLTHAGHREHLHHQDARRAHFVPAVRIDWR